MFKEYRFLSFCICLLLILTGCGQNYSAITIFRYDISAAIKSLDPQFAVNADAQMIISNCFQGLLKYSSKGEIIPAAAESYSLSDDGLKYVFKLKSGLRWSDGSQLTAHDFLWALRRLFSSSSSPFAQDFSSIKGAKQILAGKLSIDSLSVSAPDDLTLLIELDAPNSFFLSQLTTTAAMPCRESYFTGQKGRYGLAGGTLLFNGPFTVKNWSSSSVSLRKNEYYTGQVAAAGVDLHIGRGNAAGLFAKGDSDFCLLPYENIGDRQVDASNRFYNQVWSLVFNQRLPVYANERVRASLSSVLETSILKENLPPALKPYQGIVPETSALMGFNYRELAGTPSAPTSPADLRGAFYTALSKLGQEKLPKSTLYVPDTVIGRKIGGLFQHLWQQQLSASVNIAPLPISELESIVASGQYDMALYPSAVSQNPGALLSLYRSERKGDIGYQNVRFDTLLDNAQRASSSEQAAQLYREAEELLIGSYSVLPLYTSPLYFISGDRISGAFYSPYTGFIDFSGAVLSAK